MSSRGRFGGRPPWRGGGAPPPNWNHHNNDSYDMPPPHFGDHGGPPPHFDQHRGPPPHFNEYEPPRFNKHQEAPRLLFDKFSGPQSPHFYDDGPLPVSFEDHGRPHSSCPPWQNRPPHRGDRHPANHNRGRGRGDSNGEKGQNRFGQRGKFFGRGSSRGVKTQSAQSNVTSDLDQKKLLTSKPAWLSQPGTTVNSSNPSTSKPAWLTQPVTKDSSPNPLTSKPAWLTQSMPKDSNINPNKRKPAWLSQTVAQPNNVKQSLLSVKPAWLTQRVTTTNQSLGTSQSPPPPPPSCPPPPGQPNISPQTVAPSTFIQGVVGGTNARKTNLKAVGEVKVAAPGEGNFISFKNSLQEYSQKKGFPVPLYFSYKRSYGFSATVHAADLVIQGVGIQKDRKEAEQQSAYEALKSLQLLPVDALFTTGSAKPVKHPEKKKMTKIKYERQVIIDQLRDMHRDKWFLRGYRIWADYIARGVHTSFLKPPAYIHLKKRKEKKKTETSEGMEDTSVLSTSTHDAETVSTDDEPTNDEPTDDEPTVDAATDDAPTISTDDAPTISTADAPTISTDDAPTISTDDAPTISTDDAPTISTDDAPTISTDDAATAPTDDVSTAATDDVPTDDTLTISTDDAPTDDEAAISTAATDDAPTTATDDAPTDDEPTVPTALTDSATLKVQIRTELFTQLKTVGQLKESHLLTEEEFQQQKDDIMKQLNEIGYRKKKRRVLPTTTPQVVAKKLKGDIPLLSTSFTSPNYKSQLNEFCQRFHLPVATYDTVHEASGFVSTLVYNKKAYLSTFPQDTKKAAELNVAQFVLSKVNQAPPPDPKTSVVYKNFVAASIQLEASANYATQEVKQEATPVVCIPVSSIQDLAAKSANPIISYKNKLQEACQKQKITLPVYETNKEGLLYSCNVNLAGKVYAASGCKTKKGSEQSAARVALQGLGCLVE